MKKLIIYGFLALVLLACNSDFDIHPDSNVPNEQTNNLRTVSDAIRIAENFLANQNQSSRCVKSTKSINRNKITVVGSPLSRSHKIDTLIYAIDFDDNEGFMLIASPKNVEPILAIIDKGSYSDPENLENESYQIALENTIDFVAQSSSVRPVFPEPDTTRLTIITTIPEYIDVYSVKVEQEPLTEVQWNQSIPEGLLAPNGVAGCTPIAIAQALSVFEQPKTISYTYTNKDIGSENLNWTSIKQHVSPYNCSDSYSNHLTIARFVREIGQRAGSDYSQSGVTSTDFFQVPNVMSQLLGISPSKSGKDTENLFSTLSNDRGVAIVGGIGHSFVADAIKHYVYTSYLYERNTFGVIVKSTELGSFNIKLIHYNWGWGGNCNGFFRQETLNPNKPYNQKYDYPDYENNVNGFPEGSPYYYFYKL